MITRAIKIITLYFLSIGVVTTCLANEFYIMTEEYPPFNYTKNGKLTGLSAEIVARLTEMVGHSNNTKVLPWARAYRLIQEKDGQILYSTVRTEKRENLFKWVGPLTRHTWVFYARKGSGIHINLLEDAKQVGKIGTYKDDAAELFLKENGFTNLASVIDDEQNVRKLMAKRIDLWIVGDLIGAFRAKRQGVDPSTALEIAHKAKETQLYIAFSKNTDDAIIAKWQAALDEMKADGTYDKIVAKYR